MTRYIPFDIVRGMKTKFLIMRISEDEKRKIKKAARESKSVAAFLLSSAWKTIKYRKIIEQAEALRKLANARSQKLGTLKVMEI